MEIKPTENNPNTQVEEAKEQIQKLLDAVKAEESRLDPHVVMAAKEFGRLQVEYFLESRKNWEEFQEDMRTKVFKKNYGSEETK
jgi:vacuolar-type H+-ATPase subunit H